MASWFQIVIYGHILYTSCISHVHASIVPMPMPGFGLERGMNVAAVTKRDDNVIKGATSQLTK